MSSPPYSSTARRVVAITACSSVTSTSTPSGARRPPISAATSSAPAALMSATTTWAPRLGEQPRRGAADPARPAGDQSDPAGELAARRRLRELVALERPVLDCEGLRLAQRLEPAERLGRVLHGDRAVVEVAREAGAARIRPARDDADARDEHDTRPGRVDRERACLLVEVALVVAAVPLGVLRDAVAEHPRELRRPVPFGVERHDQRLVLGVDQVVGARRADLAHLGRARPTRRKRRPRGSGRPRARRRPRPRAAPRAARAASARAGRQRRRP